MKFIKDFFNDLKNDIPQAIVFAVCVVLFVYMGFFHRTNKDDVFDSSKPFAELFYSNGCPHCKAALEYINTSLSVEIPEITIHKYELSSPDMPEERRSYFNELSKKHNLKAIPIFVYKDKYIVGFDSAEKTGVNYKLLLQDKPFDEKASGLTCNIGEDGTGGCESDANSLASAFADTEDDGSVRAEPSRKITLPLIGEIDVFKESIMFLAVTIGLVDGFNPCAMWVLVFMISVIVKLNSKKKIWLIVGSFLFSSGLFYYALLAGWINLFELIGYIKLLNVLIGCIAIYTGFASLKSFFMGEVVCKVVDAKTSKNIKNRIVELADRPLGIGVVIGVISLAIVVNGIEFVCSAALPAVFTSVLAFSNLSTFMRYWYITVYDFFFILDDIIVFSLAAFAASKYNGDKYMVWCKLIGGLIILVLGIMLLFFPTYLR